MENITLPQLVRTKPLNQWQRNKLGNEMVRSLKRGAGKSASFRFSVGDNVIDTTTGFKITITERFRENGHNKYAAEQGFFREKDLFKS